MAGPVAGSGGMDFGRRGGAGGRSELAKRGRGGLAGEVETSANDRIVLKPTPWFLVRAVAMLAMFGVFAGWFLYDWKIGYPKKNLVYCLHRTFERAGQEFLKRKSAGGIGVPEWEALVASAKVEVPENPALLPPDTARPLLWPEILKDHERLSAGKWHDLWVEFTAERKMPVKPPEHLYDEGKIREQVIAGAVCAVLAAGALLLLVRTMGRTIEVDAEGIKGPGGRKVAWRELKRLDRRKWETKGLAFLWHDDGGSERRIRLDGLTYGGFKAEQGAPAEQLMQRVMANFSGELIDYEVVSAEGPEDRGQ